MKFDYTVQIIILAYQKAFELFLIPHEAICNLGQSTNFAFILFFLIRQAKKIKKNHGRSFLSHAYQANLIPHGHTKWGNIRLQTCP
jgi:hypothetical protein